MSKGSFIFMEPAAVPLSSFVRINNFVLDTDDRTSIKLLLRRTLVLHQKISRFILKDLS